MSPNLHEQGQGMALLPSRILGLGFPDSETIFKRGVKAELCLVPPGRDPGGFSAQMGAQAGPSSG